MFLAEAAAGEVLSKVISLATDQLRLDIVLGFREEIHKLKESSTQIGNLIRDAAHEPEDRKLQARADWMKRLISVAYNADDILDEIEYEVHRIRIEETLDKKILGFFCNNPVVFRLKMARKIYNINTSLENLKKDAPAVGLVITMGSNGGAAASQGRRDRETTSFPDAKIVGRDQVVLDIIATLTTSHNQENIPSVMAIVGLGGLGKTTVARSVTKQLKEGEMKKYFDTTLWVYVSNNFDVNSILHRMVQSCGVTGMDSSNQQVLIENLQQKLKDKRYFLVLDDVWNEKADDWSKLMGCLSQLNSAKGSSVIVTTRSAKVASIMETLPRCDLETLSDDECWSILKDRAFADPNALIPSKLEEIGRDIAKKCAGLPLLAKVLGSLMRLKNSEEEWLSILRSPIWQQSSDEEDSRIVSVLRLSFDNLKSPLKQCFAYCSMLERGSLIERDNLIQLWMAQGFLKTFLHPSHDHQSNQGIEMEGIGSRYFDTLLENSLFQSATNDEDGFITKCKMHDLVHDLAIEVSKCESLTPDLNHEMDDHEIRHVARIPTQKLESMSKTNISRLRSLFSNDHVSNTNFRKFRALRVLSFFGNKQIQKLPYSLDKQIQKLPYSLGKLKHLRYLDLSQIKIESLPKSIGKLYNLQTLRLPGDLEKCPKEIQNLINLRHFYFGKGMKFKAEILERLTNLRTLPSFNVGKERGPAIKELGGLKRLRGHLTIRNLEHVRDGEEAKKAFLVEKSHLSKVTFKWTPSRWRLNDNETDVLDDNETDVLDGLEPHGNLQSLKISCFEGARFPSWITSLQNLKQIILRGCEGVPTLGHLPNLRSLEINGRMEKLKRVGAEFHGYSDTSTTLFPALKTLSIWGCEELIEWTEAPRISAEGEVVKVFPCLEELSISRCDSLQSIAITQGIASLRQLNIWACRGLSSLEVGLDYCTSLQELNISSCPKLVSIPTAQGMPSLRKLDLVQCNGLSSLGSGLNYCTSLQKLDISYCPKLMSIPIAQGIASLRELKIHGYEALSSLEVGLDYCTSLQELDISGCRNLMSIPIAQGIASLRQLKIHMCEALASLEVGLDCCTSLQELKISYCPKLMSIPTAQGMPSLRKLTIERCDKLSSLGSGLNYCTSLQKLGIEDCHNLTSIPITQGITSLRRLSIDSCKRLLSLPSGLQFCTSLEYLVIRDCSSLVSMSVSYVTCDHPDSTNQPEEISTGVDAYLSLQEEDCPGLESIPPNLRHLLICHCGKFKSQVPTGFHRLTRLKTLRIGAFWEELDAFPDFQLPPPHDSQLEELLLKGWPKLKSLPQQIQHLTCLKELWISSFEGLEALPEWLGNLTSLETLEIWHCKNLKYLPTQNALTKLQHLNISNCPLLEERCTKETGPEWPKISHIPYLRF
ncbi:putative P-loop containing nucleoside triphosphate hydrolase, leucine-rich repeat domain, L [Rosa chinensis]|uniref:Putative P-loop containing nucleoside triphosphate hydrolase, leucine-rich repeat domain, L n=1 Tax=Rosa chinensis TaxID=74649 RepID=A0A2P6QX75_ROSCH|nr:putative disease resistance protein RGA4 [Rosa chinensis]XP_024193206.1 putative disease resistance protein RGA4 [Rosa chinensis]XP_024193207.1 putative disease resistance protein RGA4 [Rosa chinensis]XP_024193208.1 putative disease resistance protein RGA4 [Rosa chinensis]XP_024193209.1 putative disease resistance protein RGA4 [Rosa chinensis]XP_024193210.1 putative disease resistance protein RGA4 [Rosa chinensis]XP_024193212.1 putative disease resistance protein RGA4 [Rosa chinensis]XP_0